MTRIRLAEDVKEPDYNSFSGIIRYNDWARANGITPLFPEEQPGPQALFAHTDADIAIFGGSAGGGKSYALLMEPVRTWTNANFSCVIFRRTTPSIRNPGALWDESMSMYMGLPPFAVPNPTKNLLEWTFPTTYSDVPGPGARVKFAHLEYDDTVHDWHGSQVPLICFDELTEFTQKQFFYMLSRNRSTCGVKPFIRATCNPDADSWVAKFIAWWIDPETGFPIPERAGVKRWFVRVGDELRWAGSPQDLTHEFLGIAKFDKNGNEIELRPKSVTFIPSTLFDNQELMKKDPGYLANLLALPTVERERLLKGNWLIKPAAGLHFKRSWILPENWINADEVPKDLVKKRGWDLAATEKTQLNDPDYTCSTLIGKAKDASKDPYTYILDHSYVQWSSGKVEAQIKEKAAMDGREVQQWIPQDPGQAGKSQALNFKKLLDGYSCYTTPEAGDKLVRFGPFSSVAEARLVKVVRAPWNERWLTVLEAFDNTGEQHDDDVDSTSRAFNAFLDGTTGLIDYYRKLAEETIAKELKEKAPPVTPTVDNGGVVLKPPSEVQLLIGLRGEPILPRVDGSFVLNPDHAKQLRKSGWVDA